MSENNGWFKLYRALFDKPIWKGGSTAQNVLLITLLNMVSYREAQRVWKGEKIKLEPGQLITSIEMIRQIIGPDKITTKQIRLALDRFEELGFLANETANKGRLITIVNWDLYQFNDSERANKTETDIENVIVLDAQNSSSQPDQGQTKGQTKNEPQPIEPSEFEDMDISKRANKRANDFDNDSQKPRRLSSQFDQGQTKGQTNNSPQSVEPSDFAESEFSKRANKRANGGQTKYEPQSVEPSGLAESAPEKRANEGGQEGQTKNEPQPIEPSGFSELCILKRANAKEDKNISIKVLSNDNTKNPGATPDPEPKSKPKKAKLDLSLLDIQTEIAEKFPQPEVREALQSFAEMRQEIRAPLTAVALNLLLKRLSNPINFPTPESIVDATETAIISKWKSIYPQKSFAKPPKSTNYYDPLGPGETWKPGEMTMINDWDHVK